MELDAASYANALSQAEFGKSLKYSFESAGARLWTPWGTFEGAGSSKSKAKMAAALAALEALSIVSYKTECASHETKNVLQSLFEPAKIDTLFACSTMSGVRASNSRWTLYAVVGCNEDTYAALTSAVHRRLARLPAGVPPKNPFSLTPSEQRTALNLLAQAFYGVPFRAGTTRFQFPEVVFDGPNAAADALSYVSGIIWDFRRYVAEYPPPAF